MKTSALIFVTILCGIAWGQGAKKGTPAPTPPPVIEETSFPLPLELRDKFRDLQHQNDSLEIENQKMLVKIEQNKAKQSAILDQETQIASQFGRDKKLLDLSLYELDPAPVVLRKKKAQ